MATDFSPTAFAAFLRSSSHATGMTNTYGVLLAPRATSVLNTFAVSMPVICATVTPSTASSPCGYVCGV